MKQQFKRLLCIASALVLTASCLPDVQTLFPDNVLTASAEDGGSCGENMFWALENGVLTISGTGKMKTYGYGKAPWYAYRAEIQHLVIADGVTNIADISFFDCYMLRDAAIPDSVKSIGQHAFLQCTALGEITFPKGAVDYGQQAFLHTLWLVKMQEKDPLVIVNGVLIDGSQCYGEVTVPDGVTAIAEGAFRDCNTITKVTLPDSVTQIGEQAFWECKALTEIRLSANLEAISSFMLIRCSSLTSVTIPDGVKEIRFHAFEDCTSLKEITLPESIETIKDKAFNNCAALESVTILNPDCDIECFTDTINNTYDTSDPPEPTYTGDIFGYTPSTAQEFAERCGCTFISCGERPEEPLTYERGWDWNLEDGVLTFFGSGNMLNFSQYAPWYEYRESVQKIVLMEGLTSIGDNAFRGFTALKMIKIPDGVRSIGSGAFKDCTSLYMVNMPDSMESIGDEAFDGCEQLKAVRIPESLTKIGAYAFRGTPWLSTQQEKSPMVIVNHIVVSGENCEGAVTIPEGVTAIGDHAFYETTALESVILPKSLRMIGRSAFEGCTFLEQITIPEGLTEIGSNAFKQALKLKSVSLPDTVQRIGKEAFYGCSSLADLTVSKRTAEIGGMAFRGTPWLAARQKENPLVVVNGILIDGSNCEGDVVIPDSVKLIGDNAFEECEGVKRIKIPKSVSSIGERAFALCKALEEIWVMAPKCSIPRSSDTIFNHNKSTAQSDGIFDGMIHGYAGSTAQKYASNNNYSFQVIPPIHGDYNGDFSVSMADAVLLARFAAEHHETLADIQISRILAANPDYDGDGGITVTDLTALLAAIAGKDSSAQAKT